MYNNSDGIIYKNKRYKIWMGYGSLHYASVQCLQVNDVILILSSAVYCGFGRCGFQGFAWWHYDVTVVD